MKRAVFEIDDAGSSSARLQIRDDRYYAAHLFGDLRDARAVPILIPLLKDQDVNWIVPWSLGEIGDKSAIPPLIEARDSGALLGLIGLFRDLNDKIDPVRGVVKAKLRLQRRTWKTMCFI